VQVDVKEGKITVKLDVRRQERSLVKCDSDTKNFDVLATEADLKVEVKNATVKVSERGDRDQERASSNAKGAEITIKSGRRDRRASGRWDHHQGHLGGDLLMGSARRLNV
jgi:hypothetical protein